MSLCHLGAETETQISKQRSSSWATNYNRPGLGAFGLLGLLLHVGHVHPHHVVAWWLLLNKES